MSDFENEIILQDENGKDVKFDLLDLIEYNSEEYVVLLPQEDETGEVVILKVIEGDADYDNYVGISDEKVLNAVFGIFKEKYKDEFDFAD